MAEALAPPATLNGQPGMGGAILNSGGTMALTGCTVASNNAIGGNGLPNATSASAGGAGQGGAVYNLSGNLYVTNCSFSANGATGGSGGYQFGQGSAGGDACGGAIYSLGGNVTVQNSAFVSHATQGGSPGTSSFFPGQAGGGFGGAIWSSNTIVNFYNSTFTSNLAVGAALPFSGSSGGAGSAEGGAVFANGGVVNCFGCTFTTNAVAAGSKARYGGLGVAQGGAIWSAAVFTASQCSFLGNQCTGNYSGAPSGEEGSGGAIFTGNSFSLSASLFAGNRAQGGTGGIIQITSLFPGGIGRGGAICNLGTLAATNCTFMANSAAGGQGAGNVSQGATTGGNGAGGGLFNSGTAILLNLTFASNNALGGPGGNTLPPLSPGAEGSSLGGAICNSNGTINLYNTILAYSASGSNCWGTVSDMGYNLGSDTSAGFYAPGSLNNTDPKLGPLGNYGGPTLTLPLLAGSPAIDGGNTATAPATDQRGHARPYGAAADIGAFESSPPFFIGGQVSGSTLRDQVTIVVGPFNLATTNGGIYGASAIAAGSYSVTPTSPNYLFIPASLPLTVGPDQFGINFKAYHWNALSLEAITNGSMYCIIADSNGLTCRVLTSTDLIQWLPVSTNILGPSNYFETFLPMTGEPARYYRTAIP
jgi:hypothetical protein